MVINDLKKYYFNIKVDLSSHHYRIIDENICLLHIEDLKDYLNNIVNDIIKEYHTNTNEMRFVYTEEWPEISSLEDTEGNEIYVKYEDKETFFEKCLSEVPSFGFLLLCHGIWFTFSINKGERILKSDEVRFLFNCSQEERDELSKFVKELKEKGLA